MQHRAIIAALLLLSLLATQAQARAQSPDEVERGLPPVAEPRVPSLPSPGFDPQEFEVARSAVLRTRNWFLGSVSVFAVGSVLLGTGIGQCREFGGIAACSGRGDRLSRAGLAIAWTGSLAVISTVIAYGVRVKQERQLQRLAVEHFTYGDPGLPPVSFDEYRLADAKDRSRRARNALIGSAAMLTVGSIFLGFAIPRCEAGNDGFVCTDPGYAHFALGLTLAGSGAIGTIVSAALLGVRNGKKRSLARSVHQRQVAGLRWDPALGCFVF